MLSFDSERGFAGDGEGDMEMTRPGREPNFGAVMGLYIAAISMLAMYGCGQELIEADEFTFEKLPSDAVSDVGVTDSTVPGDVSTSVDGAVQAEVVADASVTDTASSSDTSGGPVATVEQPLAGGEKHSCQIHEDATVVCWGSNDDGQLGNGTNSSTMTPFPVADLADVTAVALGTDHSCAMQGTGQVLCWGSNDDGQLGDGTVNASSKPVAVKKLTDAKAISAGNSHSCAMQGTGQVLCWGKNDDGQLGDGTSVSQTKPVAVDGLADAMTISAGGQHSCAVKQTGAVACWGGNQVGQLGNGDKETSTKPVAVQGLSSAKGIAAGLEHSCALKNDGTVVCWGGNNKGELGNGSNNASLAPTSVKGLSDVTAIEAGAHHTCALTEEGAVLCWGSNDSGQLGNDNSGDDESAPVAVVGLSDVTTIAAGLYHTCALKADDETVCWGSNESGQLGNGNTNDKSTPTSVEAPTESKCPKGAVTKCDDDKFCTTDTCNPVKGCEHTPVTDATACSDDNACTEKDSCEGGKCIAGKLTVCDDKNPCTADSCDDKTGKCGHLNLPMEATSCNADDSVCTVGDACEAGKCAAGPNKKCDDGNVCTTDGCDAKTGCTALTNTSPCDADSNACTVADTCKDKSCVAGKLTVCDDNNPCTADSCDNKSGKCIYAGLPMEATPCNADDSVCTVGDSCKAGKCTAGAPKKCDDANVCTTEGCEAKTGCSHGANTEACDADSNACTVADTCKAKSCVAGKLTVCNDKAPCTVDSCDDKTGKCVYDGKAKEGKACDADGSVCTEKDACKEGKCVAGKTKSCDDQNLFTTDSCDTKTGKCVYKTSIVGSPIATGPGHTCAVNDDGTVACWGYNEYGQLGDGTDLQMAKPTPVTKLKNVKTLALGTNHSCALKDDGIVVCWGYNYHGQLGNGENGKFTTKTLPTPAKYVSSVKAITTGHQHTCALKADGTVICWGNNEFGQLGDGTKNHRYMWVAVTGLSGIKAIAAGDNHTCAVKSDGAVTCWGDNQEGQLGDTTKVSQNKPTTTVDKLKDAVAISAGLSHSCALKKDGTVACWGYNGSGQLGNGKSGKGKDNYATTTPVAVKGLANAKAITSSRNHNCALNTDGTVACWGANLYGQLGDGTSSEKTVATAVKGLSGAVAIAAGGYSSWPDMNGHTCALKADGSLVCWGGNNKGQLGDGTSGEGTNKSIPVAVKGFDPSAPDATGKLFTVGADHTCALRDNGTAACWGDNTHGQLGNGTKTATTAPVTVKGLSGAKAIVAGQTHTCALKTDGTMACWGKNDSGQLGDGTKDNTTAPVTVKGLSGAKAIASGYQHTCALKNNGTGACWGLNTYGQLGNGNYSVQTTPTAVKGLAAAKAIAVGQQHSCALHDSGDVICWGDNQYGQLGDGTMENKGILKATKPLTGAKAIAAGIHQSCALKNVTKNKEVLTEAYCWGNNEFGQIGNGLNKSKVLSSTKVIDNLKNAKAIKSGYGHTCALKTDGSMACWGRNDKGQLGDGSKLDKTKQTAVKGFAHATFGQPIAVGGTHSCALKAGGTAACWGRNQYGQLGDGTMGTGTEKNVPTTVKGLVGATAIAGGENHTCALKTDGTVACWGENQYGQLGDGTMGSGVQKSEPTAVKGLSDVKTLALGTNHSCALKKDGTVACWGSDYYGQLGGAVKGSKAVPTAVQYMVGIEAIAVGGYHTCVLHKDSNVSCWGFNDRGQLGNGKKGNKSEPTAVKGLTNAKTITAGKNHTCAIKNDGSVECWGYNSNGQIGMGSGPDKHVPTAVTGLTNAKVIVAGFRHTCALKDNNSVSCWGDNKYGQLGDGTLNEKTTPHPVKGLTNVKAIEAGMEHTCVLKYDGTVACWGDNGSGRLGNGTMTDKKVPTGVVGL